MVSTIAGKRIGLLSTWASRRNGGVFEALVAQAELLGDLGASPIVFALADQEDCDRDRLGDIPVITTAPLGPAFLGYGPKLGGALAAAELDCLHLHGIWQFNSHAGAVWAHRTGRPYLISPHGMLDPWILARGRGKKWLARGGYERRSWQAARLFHALTQSEATDIARATGRNECAIIPNPAPELQPERGESRSAEIAYIGRIHPKKNLAALIKGWSLAVAVLPADARLTIAGWGEDADLAALRGALEGVPRAQFIGPVFGDEKRQLLARARFVALASHSEGLPMAMLEAWAAGCPTLMSRACNLPEGYAAGAAIDSGTSADAVAVAIIAAFAMPPTQWQAMSGAARALAAGTFAKATAAARWEATYAKVIGPAAGRDRV